MTATARSWTVVGVAALASFVGRLVLARDVGSPFIFQDEGGYIAVARLLVGEGPALYGPTYLPGWGLLLVPAAAVLDPASLHTAAQVLNAAVAAATIPALYVLGRRVVGLTPLTGAAAAIAGGVTASSIVQATMLLPEVLLVLVVVVSVLALHRALEAGTPGWAAGAGALVGLTHVVHPRAVVGLVALVLVAGLVALAGEVRRSVIGILVGAAVAVAGAGQVLHVWATSQLYPVGTRPSLAGSPLGALGEPAGAAVIALGQSWYVAVATLGLAPLGALAAGRLGWHGWRSPRGQVAAFVVLGVLGSLALGTIGSYEVGLGVDVGRADLPVYGRYLEHWIPVLVVLGPALHRRWVLPGVVATAGAIAAAGVLVERAYPVDTWYQPLAWHNVATLRLPVEVLGRAHVTTTGVVVAAAVLVLVGAVAVIGRRAWFLPLAGMALLNIGSGVELVQDWAAPSSDAWQQRQAVGGAGVVWGRTVWVDRNHDFHVHWAYNAQFWHPELDVSYYDGTLPAGGELVIGSPTRPPSPGAELVLSEPDGTVGLWSLDP